MDGWERTGGGIIVHHDGKVVKERCRKITNRLGYGSKG